MILKKPYAIIIKYFRLIHMIITFCVGFLLYRTNLVLQFLSKYISSETSFVGQNLIERLFNSWCFIIPIIIILFSIVFFGIMFNKKKPFIFYVISFFSFVVLLIMFLYSYNMIKQMEINVLDIRTIKVIHDLLIVLMGIEVMSFVVFLIRGIGFDITKFDFLSDLNKLEISEEDKEEFELDVKIDFDEKKRKSRKIIRHIKYAYQENKMFANFTAILFALIIIYLIISKVFVFSDDKKQGDFFQLEDFSINIVDSYLTQKSYLGKKILTDNYIATVKMKIKSVVGEKKLNINNFKLLIDNKSYDVTNKYSIELIDLGQTYLKNTISTEYKYYILSFEIPKKYINTKMILKCSDSKINLNPKNVDEINTSDKYKIGDEVKINDSVLNNTSINIKTYEIADKFKINYNFKLNENTIYNSVEYIQPKLDSNYEEYLLKLSINAKIGDDTITINDLLNNYSYIKYIVDENTFIDRPASLIESKAVNQEDTYYLEVNKNITKASTASFIIDTRYKQYEIVLF